jgi:N-acyl-D-amino-acid deacylase
VRDVGIWGTQTQVLAYWVRRRQALTLEEGVRMLTLEPASAWGLHERGLLREGLAADVIVFDPDRVAPDMPEVVNDLPAGARRLRQKATGFHASIVNGQVVLRDGEHTGAHPGRVLRGPLAAGADGVRFRARPGRHPRRGDGRQRRPA